MEPSAPPPPDDNILFSALADFEADEKRAEASTPPTPAPTPAAAVPPGNSPDDFAKNMSALLKELALAEGANKPGDVQSSITKTLASLAESAKKLEEQAASSTGGAGGADSEAVLEKLLEQFGSNQEFQGMMENMVQQLMSKDIMYGPLKEMKEKYPDWLQKNSATLSATDLARYQKQAALIGNICELYEKEPTDMPRIMSLMQEMQECGQPPQEIIKELAPDAGAELPAGAPGAPGGGADPNCLLM